MEWDVEIKSIRKARYYDLGDKKCRGFCFVINGKYLMPDDNKKNAVSSFKDYVQLDKIEDYRIEFFKIDDYIPVYINRLNYAYYGLKWKKESVKLKKK